MLKRAHCCIKLRLSLLIRTSVAVEELLAGFANMNDVG